MAKVPGQRKAGQTGGGGRHHVHNRSASSARGGRPHAGGGGTGRKPPTEGPCLVWAFVILGTPVAAVWGLWELFS